jgi:hypothetical protein
MEVGDLLKWVYVLDCFAEMANWPDFYDRKVSAQVWSVLAAGMHLREIKKAPIRRNWSVKDLDTFTGPTQKFILYPLLVDRANPQLMLLMPAKSETLLCM